MNHVRLPGHATAESTRVKNATMASAFESRRRPLYPEGPFVTPVGFGCYRIGFHPSLGYPECATALEYGLQSGQNLIDTSTNYGDGQSEMLVGRTLAKVVSGGKRTRDEFVVVTKLGYLQGENLELGKARELEGRPFQEMTKLGDEIWHCIHPSFIRDQIERSRSRLGIETIDVILLHNPEYMLKKFELDKVQVDEARATFYMRLEESFACLEGLVKEGVIASYGVSSNTFASEEGLDPTAVSLSRCLESARRVSSSHHFRVAQMPMNWIEVAPAFLPNETEKDTPINFAAQHGIGVLLNRPLNAMHNNGLIRLARPEFTDEQIKALKPEQAAGIGNWKNLARDLERLAKEKITTMGYDDAPLSQLVLATLLWQEGVSAVLCGSRRMRYIKDVEATLQRPKLLHAHSVLSQIFESLEFSRVDNHDSRH